MKKVLSVLLTAALLLGCCSVGLVSFAAAPADEAAMAKQLKDTSTYATQKTNITVKSDKWNENTYTSIPANYNFVKQVTTTADMPNESDLIAAAGDQDAYEANVLAPIVADGGYEKYITRDDKGTATSVNVAKIITDTIAIATSASTSTEKKDGVLDTLGVQPVAYATCQPGKTGNNPIGEDALKVIELSAEDIKNYNPDNGSFTLDDIVIADQTAAEFTPAKTEDSALAKVVAVLASSKADEILTALKTAEGISDITNYVFKITNINVAPSFQTMTISEDSKYGDVEYKQGDEFVKLAGLRVSYDVSVALNARFTFCDVAFPMSATQSVNATYSNITETFTETTDSAMTAEKAIELINAETAYVSKEATGTDAHHAGGYTFSKSVTAQRAMHTGNDSTIGSQYMASFDNVLKTHPEYNKYLCTNSASLYNGKYYDEEKGVYTYDNILMDKVGLSANGDIVYDGTPYNVTTGVNGAEILGVDALKAMNLTSENVNTFSFNAGSMTATITLKDQQIAPLEDEAIYVQAAYDNILPAGFETGFAEEFRNDHFGSSIENIEVVYQNPTITAVFDSDYNLTSIRIAYNIAYSASVYLADIMAEAPISGVYSVVINYNGIEKFDEENGISPYELADAINAATDYATYNKAGYSYERNANFTSAPQTDISASTLGKITGVIDQIAGTLGGGSDETVTERVNKAVSDFLLGDMDVTDYNNVVPVTKDGEAYVGANYALKATSVQPNDLKNIAYNADRGVITFSLVEQLNPEKDGENALSRLTNDFTSTTDLRNKLGLQISNAFNIPFISDDEPCDVTYNNINCYVAFDEADESNTLGNGELSVLGVGYTCTLGATFSGITINAAEKMASEYNAFDYFDYEMGDVDMSTRVSVVDAKLVLQMVAGLTTLEGRSFELADMNYDGKISTVDAKKILQKIAAN